MNQPELFDTVELLIGQIIMSDRTISLKLSPKLLQQAEEIAGSDESLHDFLISAIENEVQRRKGRKVFKNKVDFWQEVERLREGMQQEKIEIDPQEIWGDVRDKGIGREITL